ncbi:MAG: hypothetical protein K6G88_09960, partial [Lachnospiraceae bacterium]|nr:hypothetical protein [Lachnospiraceae bacterium]
MGKKIIAALVAFFMCVCMMSSTVSVPVKADYSPHYPIFLYANGSKFEDGKTEYMFLDSVKITKKYYPIDKPGYGFVGWATYPSAKTPMYKRNDTIKVYNYTTLYAVWVPYKKLTVSPNGGYFVNNNSTASRTFTVYPFSNITLSAYKFMSASDMSTDDVVAVKNNYTFVGYKDMDKSYEKLTDYYPMSSVYSDQNRTVYAVYKPNNVDRWGMANNGYALTNQQIYDCFGETYGNTLLDFWKKSGKTPGAAGLCYGMALTMAASEHGELPISSLIVKNSSKKKMHDFTTFSGKYLTYNGITFSPKTYIQYAWAYQYSYAAASKRKWVENNSSAGLKDFVSAVNKATVNNEAYYHLGIYYDSTSGKAEGHSIVALYVDSDNNDYTTIKVYDCNHPNLLQDFKIHKTSGVYDGWEYAPHDEGQTSSNPINSKKKKKSDKTYPSLNYKDVTKEWARDFPSVFDSNKYWYSNWAGKGTNCLITSTEASELDIKANDVAPVINEDGTYGIYWVSGENININEIDKNAQICITDQNASITVTTKDDTDIDVNMKGKDKITFNTEDIKEVTYECGDDEYTIIPTGKDEITLKLEEKIVSVSNADKAGIK